ECFARSAIRPARQAAQHRGLEQIQLAAQLVVRAGLQILQSIRATRGTPYRNAWSSHRAIDLLHVTAFGEAITVPSIVAVRRFSGRRGSSAAPRGTSVS